MFRVITSWLASIYPVFSLNLQNADNYAIKVQDNYIFLHYEQNHCYFNLHIFTPDLLYSQSTTRKEKYAVLFLTTPDPPIKRLVGRFNKSNFASLGSCCYFTGEREYARTSHESVLLEITLKLRTTFPFSGVHDPPIISSS